MIDDLIGLIGVGAMLVLVGQLVRSGFWRAAWQMLGWVVVFAASGSLLGTVWGL